MNGIEAYNSKYEKAILNSINGNEDLEGFRDFIYTKSLSSTNNYINVVKGFLRYVQKEPSELKFQDFAKYLRVKKEGTTSSYQINIYHALKRYSQYLYVSGEIQKDYMESLERPAARESMKTIERRQKAFLTRDEMNTYVDAIRNEYDPQIRSRNMAIVMLLLTTGIRCSALYKLDVSDVNLSDQTIHVTDKGSHARICYFSDECKRSLWKWLNERNDYHPVDDALFINPCNGKRICQKTISRVIERYNYAVPNKKLSPHKLRATYGTQVYESTRDIYFTQECMGHSSPTTTERYIRGQENQTKKAASIVGDIFK